MQQAKHRLIIISPDGNTDFCYLDMSPEQAMAKFKEHEDWIAIYEPKGYVPEFKELAFDDSFMLWRNVGNELADRAQELGMPDAVTQLLRGWK